jgi:hypothetical protein
VADFKKWLLDQMVQARTERLGADAATLRGAT